MTSDTSAGIDDNQNADVVCEQCTFNIQDNNYRNSTNCDSFPSILIRPSPAASAIFGAFVQQTKPGHQVLAFFLQHFHSFLIFPGLRWKLLRFSTSLVYCIHFGFYCVYIYIVLPFSLMWIGFWPFFLCLSWFCAASIAFAVCKVFGLRSFHGLSLCLLVPSALFFLIFWF